MHNTSIWCIQSKDIQLNAGKLSQKAIPFGLITTSSWLTSTSGFQNAKDWPMPEQKWPAVRAFFASSATFVGRANCFSAFSQFPLECCSVYGDCCFVCWQLVNNWHRFILASWQFFFVARMWVCWSVRMCILLARKLTHIAGAENFRWISAFAVAGGRIQLQLKLKLLLLQLQLHRRLSNCTISCIRLRFAQCCRCRCHYRLSQQQCHQQQQQ